MWRLLYPLRYFTLINREKRALDLLALPLALLVAAPFWVLRTANFFAGSGFLEKLLALLSALAGFFVAALVAAATFAHPDLDKVITSGPVYERRGSGADRHDEALSRRQLTCMIFGYLAFICLVMSLLAAIVVTTAAPLKALLQTLDIGKYILGQPWPWIRAILIYLISLPLAHIFVVTGLGLYYLIDRLHAKEPQVLAKKPDRKAA